MSIKTPLDISTGLALNNTITIDQKIWLGKTVSVAHGGTGAITAAQACINLGAVSVDSPHFTGIPRAPTVTITDSSSIIANTEFVLGAIIAANSSVVSIYKGKIDITLEPPVNSKTGDTWRVSPGGIPNSSFNFSTPVSFIDTGDFIVFDGSNWNKKSAVNPKVFGYSNIQVIPTGDKYFVSLTSSPAFTGTPTAPTPNVIDNSSAIATTAFVISNENQNAVSLVGAITGVATGSGLSTTLATVNTTTGTFGSVTLVPSININAKGLITTINSQSATFLYSNLASKPTTLAGYGITDAIYTNSPVLNLPLVPTANFGDNSTTIANTTFVQNAIINSPFATSGDLVGSGTSPVAAILATVNTTTGTFGSTTNIPVITINKKGLVTAVTNTLISPTWSAISGKPTTISGYGITDAASLASPAFTGTPTTPTPNVGDNSTKIATTAYTISSMPSIAKRTFTSAFVGSGYNSIPINLVNSGVTAKDYGLYSTNCTPPNFTVTNKGIITAANNNHGWSSTWGYGTAFLNTSNSWGVNWLPATDNSYNIGESDLMWSVVWAVNGTIQTSDAREKTEITPSVLGLDFINALQPVSYKWIVGKNIDDKPLPGTRRHFGLISQQVKQICDELGIDFGGYTLADKDDLNSKQSLRYAQFISPLIKAVQELSKRKENTKLAIFKLRDKLEALIGEQNG